jgi:HlyD family secretion protein
VTEIGASAVPRGQAAGASTSSASTSNQAKDFKVTVTLKDPPPALRPGLNATAEVTTARRSNPLVVPIQAVVVRQIDDEGKVVDPSTGPAQGGPDSNKTVVNTGRAKLEEKDGVFVVDQQKAVFRPIKTGIMGDTDVEVLEGLTEGQELVTGSYRTLRTLKDQAKIKPEDQKKKA